MNDIEIDLILANAEIARLKAENERVNKLADDYSQTILMLEAENENLREAITAAYLQLETATFSTNKGAADLAKFIITYLPEPPQKGE